MSYPMAVTCPECHKRLNVPQSALGKKVRCPACKKVVVLSEPGPAASRPMREKAPARPVEARTPADAVVADTPDQPMRCAQCKSAALEALPRNLYSRRPGYVCTECGAKMRPPGSTGAYIGAIILGAFTVVLGLSGVVIAAFSNTDGFQNEGGLMTMVLGLAVISWCYYQLRLPVPLDAPPRPSRIWLWVVVILLVLLVMGGAYFGFMYYLQEML
jgi:predicted Zn finger-like uncharacterized protein